MSYKKYTPKYTPKYIKNDALWAVIAQFVGVMTIIPLVWLFCGQLIAGSIGLGGVICLVPNLYLYRSIFKYAGAAQAKSMLTALYWGAAVKFCLTMLLFALVLVYSRWVSVPYLFIGYIFVQIMFWVGPALWGIVKKS